ncbi:MAG: hypothetical protein JXR59_01805 [Desulfuromonadaceae bacterium]|nr:hypothetical protein [Desulfuromonadaceae bacterium]
MNSQLSLKEFESLMVISNQHYLCVLECMRGLEQKMNQSANTLWTEIEHFLDLQRKAEAEDVGLLPLLKSVKESAPQHPLIVQRQEVLDEILKVNRLLLPKINGMMALVSHELKELRSGRTVISGYRPSGVTKPSRLRSKA